ncbi:30S ribosomal protein S9, partial [bacterium]|nr:30S ribosomal protein S9 [bacterium]
MVEKKKIEKKASTPKKRKDYIYATGKRKTAIARVRLYSRKTEKAIIINEKKLNEYFQTIELQNIVLTPLKTLDLLNKYYISVKVLGGGIKSQAESVRHGISKILLMTNE